MRIAILSDEAIALDACKQLVSQGKNFTCNKVSGGWLFKVGDPLPLLMLRFDGELWEIEPGEGTEETTVKARVAKTKKDHPEDAHDQKAIDAGCTHVQTSYGGELYREVRRVR